MSEAQESHHAFGRRILRGLFVLVFFGIFWKIGGLLINVIMAAYYSAERTIGTLDAFAEVFNVLIFTFLYSTLLKVIVPAFMPLFAEEREARGEESAWRLTSTLINLTLIGGVATTVGVMLFAPQLIATLVPGFDAPTQRIAARLLSGMMPGVVVMFFAVLALGILNSYKVFSYPSAADAAQKLAWAAVLIVLIRGFGMAPESARERPIYLGFLVGAAAQLAVLLCGLRSKRRLYRPAFPGLTWRRATIETAYVLAFAVLCAAWIAGVRAFGAGRAESDLRFLEITGGAGVGFAYAAVLWLRARRRTGLLGRFAALAAPLMIGVVFARYRDLTSAFFQSYTQSGVFGSMELAKKVGNLPTVLLAYSLSIAMFPYLCDLAVKKDLTSFGRLLTDTVHTIALFAVPLTVGMIVLNGPIMEVVYDRGAFDEDRLLYGGLGLAMFCSAMVFYALENVVMQSYFSIKRMWAPTLLGMIAALAHSGLLFGLVRVLHFDSPAEVFAVVALTFPVTRALKNVVLMALLRAHIPYLPARRSLVFLAKLCAVSAAVGAAAWAARVPVRRVVAPQRYRQREVVVDTFNPEPRGWFSHHAQTIAVEEGRLRVVYERRARRNVSWRRDLTDFDLTGAEALLLRIRWGIVPLGGTGPYDAKEQGARFAVALEAADGGRIQTTVDRPGDIELRWEGAAPRFTRLLVEDRTPADLAPYRATVDLDDIRFVGQAGEVLIDRFDLEPLGWRGAASFAVGEAEARPDVPEMALRVVGPLDGLARGLTAYDLRGTSQFAFKAMASSERDVVIGLHRESGEEITLRVRVAASESRRQYRVALPGPMDHRVIRVAFSDGGSVPADAVLWLDNIAFVRPTQRARFEAAKLIGLAVPTFAGLVAFVVACWVLRLQEALAVVAWFRCRGWRERRRSASDGGAASGAAEG